MKIEKIEQIEELLKNSLSGQVLDQEVTRLTQPGENYLSVVLKVDVKIKNDKNGEEETLATVAKILPPQLGDKPMPMGTTSFKNEIAWYTHIMPTIKQFQRDRGVENVADFFATMYGGRLSLDPEKDTADEKAVLLFENLNVQGYANGDRFVGFDTVTSEAIIRALATFHAVPIAMKLQDPQLFQKEIRARLIEFKPPGPEQNVKRPEFDQAKLSIEKLIKEDPECAVLWPRVEPYTKQFFSHSHEVNEPWGTIAHTDFWVNNIMVKHQTGDLPKVKIVDFQMTPYKSAVSDLIFFLFTSVENHELITKFEHFLKYYFDQFIENLKQLKVDTDLFTYEDYLAEIGTALKESELIHAFCFMFVIFAPRGTAPDVMEVGFNPDLMTNLFARDPCETHKEKAWFTVKECCRRGWV